LAVKLCQLGVNKKRPPRTSETASLNYKKTDSMQLFVRNQDCVRLTLQVCRNVL